MYIEPKEGHTLLCRNFKTDLWIDLIQMSEPKIKQHFYVVPESLMKSFDKFREDLQQLDIDP